MFKNIITKLIVTVLLVLPLLMPFETAKAAPSLTLQKSANKTQVEPGGSLTYTLLVQNNGTEDAQDVVISDPIDTNLLDASSIVYHSWPAGSWDNSQKKINWNLGNISRGSSKTISFSIVQQPTLTGPVTWSLTLSSGTHYISLPVMPINPDPQAVFDEIPVAQLSGNLSRFDPETQTYKSWTQSNPQAFGEPLRPGEGYKLTVSSTYTISITGIIPQKYSYPLSNQTSNRQLIGLPKTGVWPVSWVKVKKQNQTLSWEQAVSQNLVQPELDYIAANGQTYHVIFQGPQDANDDWYMRANQGYFIYPKEPNLTLEYSSPITAQAISLMQIDLAIIPVYDQFANLEIQRSESQTSGFQTIATITASQTSYSDYALFPNKTYYYKVRVRGPLGTSGYTIPISAQTLPQTQQIGTVRDVALDPDYPNPPYVYLATQEYGLLVIDFSNPHLPVVIGRQDVPSEGWRLDVVKTPLGIRAVYLAGRYDSTVVTVDLTDIRRPVVTKTPVTIVAGANDLAPLGQYMYVAERATHSFRLLDLSNPNNPTEISSQTFRFDVASLSLDGNVLAAAGGNHEVALYTAEPPEIPTLLGTYDEDVLSRATYSAPYVYGVTSFGWVGRFRVIDFSDPAVPQEIGAIGDGPSPYSMVVLHVPEGAGSRRVVAESRESSVGGPSDVIIMNVNTPDHPRALSTIGLMSAGGSMITNHETTLFIADNYFDLLVYDLADPANPRPVARLTDR